MTVKPYLYSVPSSRVPDRTIDRPVPYSTDEELTGWVNGEKASDIEERVARALRGLNREFAFQVPITIPGREFENKVDFIVERRQPVEVYGEIGHDSAAERGDDAVREAQLNEFFAVVGLQPIRVLRWPELRTQELANNAVRELV